MKVPPFTNMSTVLMHGPSISKPDKIVEREVPECDVQAYAAAGYVTGPMPKPEKVEKEEAAEAPTKKKK